MKVRLANFGNSKGVRLPKAVIEACGFRDELDLTIVEGAVVLRAAGHPREGWEEAFRTGAPDKPDALLLDGPLTEQFDENEWTW